MTHILLNSIETEFKKIDKEISFKKFFLLGGLLPALISFPIFYFLNPLTQENIVNIPLGIMVILSLTCMFMLLSLHALLAFKIIRVVSPFVSNEVSEKTYLILAKNSFVKNILDLFVEKTENKLNPQWNKQGIQVAQNTERLDGHDKRIENLEHIVKVQNEKINESDKKELEYNNIIGRQGQHIFGLYWVLRHVLRENNKLVKENNELRKKQEEQDQIINKKIQTDNKDEERK